MNGVTPVMVNGLPGKMGNGLAEAVAALPGFSLFPYAYTGQEIEADTANVAGREITLIRPSDREVFLSEVKIPKELFVIDFVTPGNAIVNAGHYCDRRWNFLMGTTMSKDERTELERMVREAGVFALSSPNFAEQIVGLQKVIGGVAEEQEGKANGYTVNGWCSHQGPKKDVSGTWRAIARDLVKMGVNADVRKLDDYKVTPGQDAQIEFGPGSTLFVARNPETQHGLGVHTNNLKWHGHHSYEIVAGENKVPFESLANGLFGFIAGDSERVFDGYSHEADIGSAKRTSRDGNVVISAEVLGKNKLRIEHRINGGSAYVAGAMNGLRYSVGRIAEGAKGKLETVFDVMNSRKAA